VPPALDVFISYRREDAEAAAGRLYDTLSPRFGDDHVFMDVDAIPLGVDFTKEINRQVESCDVLIALLGTAWLSVTDDEGERRLDDPEDYVRIEIEAALERDVPVIPALLQGARMPKAADLPASLKPLARRNGIELRHGAWRSDVDRLIRELERLAHAKAEPEASERKAIRKPTARKNKPKASRTKPTAAPRPKPTAREEGRPTFPWAVESVPMQRLARNIEAELRIAGVSNVSHELAKRLEEQLSSDEQVLVGSSYERARLGEENLSGGDVIGTDRRLLLCPRGENRVVGVRWTALQGFVAEMGYELVVLRRGDHHVFGHLEMNVYNEASRLTDVINVRIRAAGAATP
jgi:hypothetical protein